MKLSIVIPAYNEERRLPRMLSTLAAFFKDQGGGRTLALHEVVVVDDGSTDRTARVAGSWADRLPMVSLRLLQNQGKGAALRAGVQRAMGDLVLLYDADGATPIEEVLILLEMLKRRGADGAIGSRVLGGGGALQRMQWHRRLVGRLYYVLTAPLLYGIRDAACGCKLFRRSVVQHLFTLQRIDRFAYDVEILWLAHVLGYRIIEVPVQWVAVPASRVRLVRDGVEMLWRVLSLYLHRFQLKSSGLHVPQCSSDTIFL